MPAPTDAIVASELLHAPPAVAFVIVMVKPIQTPDEPLIADSGLTVTVVTAVQPVGSV